MAPSNLKSPPSYSVDVENIIERYKHYVPTDAKQKHRDLFYQCIKRIESKFDEKKTWITPDIPFNVCTSLDDDTLQNINLSDTIGKARTFNQRKTRVNDENVYFLPKDYNSSEKDHRSDFILPLFSKPCQLAGFRLITKGWEWDNNCIVFTCSRCKHSTNPIFHSKPKKKTPHQTEKPVGDQPSCPFLFRVYWSPLNQRWYLPHKQAGNLLHLGHHKRDPDEIRMWSNSLDSETKDIIAIAAKMRMRPQTIARFIYELRGIELEPYQLHYMCKKIDFKDLVVNRDVAFDLSPSAAMKNMSPVDWLLHAIEARPDYSYVCIFADYDTEDLKISLRQRHKDGTLEEKQVKESELYPADFDDPDDEDFNRKTPIMFTTFGASLTIFDKCAHTD